MFSMITCSVTFFQADLASLTSLYFLALFLLSFVKMGETYAFYQSSRGFWVSQHSQKYPSHGLEWAEIFQEISALIFFQYWYK